MRQDLNAALELNKSYGTSGVRRPNPADAALAVLFIARSYTLEAASSLARDYHNKWEQLKGEVEHRIIHELGDGVGKLIAERSFSIPATLKELNYKDWETKLQKWMIETTERKLNTTNAEKIADAIGVGRSTIYKWREKFRAEAKQAPR